jgi:hypothetical protein
LKNLSYADITAKCVEISKCLLDKQKGLYDYDLEYSQNIGDLARFAVNIRQAGTIENDKLAAIAATLKIDYRLVKASMLPEMEDLGWVNTFSKNSKITKIDENIPPLQEILHDLGKKWDSSEPKDIDRASVESISILSKNPVTKDALFSELDVDNDCLQIMLEYGENASYLGTFRSEILQEEVVWTPFYWADKFDKVERFLSRQNDDGFVSLGELTREFKNFSGKPIEYVSKNAMPLVEAGIKQGYFPSVAVGNKTTNSHEYIFAATPHFGATEKDDIFEKARLIVSCIRHGQFHAEITKIKYPVSILQALRENRLGPHSYSLVQYSPLILARICTYEKTSINPIKYKIVFVDSPENNLAANIAEEMLRGEEPYAGTVDEPEVRQLLVKGYYSYSAEQRKMRHAENVAATHQYNRMMEAMRGSGVIS